MEIKNVDSEKCRRRKILIEIKKRFEDAGYLCFIDKYCGDYKFPNELEFRIRKNHKSGIRNMVFDYQWGFWFAYNEETSTITVPNIECKNDFYKIKCVMEIIFDGFNDVNIILMKDYCEE